ncbi:MAG TPA: hypothetical protein VNZ03_17665 [Terriglobales bacterium]|jgi:hypothetical protein|nr:hypothetical protein [Terriglobales bacterium]
MFRTKKPESANSRVAYTTAADFCKIFDSDMKSLYLLAFLLTANHKDAERCFLSTLEGVSGGQTVFKGWARSWVKRSLIKNAIQIVSPASGQGASKRDLWSAEQYGTSEGGEIDAVTQLAPLERFIFVMSILEPHSIWECALLLGCDMKEVVQIRMTGFRRLPELSAFAATAEDCISPHLHATA